MGTNRFVQKVAGGYRFQCALTTVGQVLCWGFNDWAQLGRGDKTTPDTYPEMGDNLHAVDLGTGKTAVQIASGGLQTCALLNDNSVKCWGYNLRGELGLGNTSSTAATGDSLPVVPLY